MDSTKSIMVGLIQGLTTAPVSTVLPPDIDKKDNFIVLSRIGGGRSNLATREGRFLIEVYAKDEDQAEVLAESIYMKLYHYHDKKIIRCIPDNNLTQFNDSDLDYIRFQFTSTALIRLTQQELEALI